MALIPEIKKAASITIVILFIVQFFYELNSKIHCMLSRL